jgi:G2/mitotic-specific cyclin 1/2
MLDYLNRPVKNQALIMKYASKRFMKASVFVKEWMKKYFVQDNSESDGCGSSVSRGSR